MIMNPKFTDELIKLCKPQIIRRHLTASSTWQVIARAEFYPNLPITRMSRNFTREFAFKVSEMNDDPSNIFIVNQH